MKLISIIIFSFFLMSASRVSQFEQKDLVGSTENISGTVGTTFLAIPSVADKVIAEVLVRCPPQTPNSKRLQVSFTSSTGPWITLKPGEFVSWSLKGYLKQIWILGNVASVDYEIVINKEP